MSNLLREPTYQEWLDTGHVGGTFEFEVWLRQQMQPQALEDAIKRQQQK